VLTFTAVPPGKLISDLAAFFLSGTGWLLEAS
jgi:hypothetical protein